MRPDNEKSIAFTPKSMDSFVYLQTSLSALRSYNRHEASSDPVLKKKYWKVKKKKKKKKKSHFYPEISLSKRSNTVLFWVMHMDYSFIVLPNGITAWMIFHCIDIGFVAFKILNVITSTHIPNKGHFVTSLIKKFMVMAGKFK